MILLQIAMVSPGSYNLAQFLPFSRSTKYTINSKGRKQKQKKKPIGMIITTWKELKPVHKLVSHVDHLNHCPIHYKNEVIQMEQTVRFGAIKKNVFEKIQHPKRKSRE